MIGVIGCLMTESGQQIKAEMLQALACHNLFPVEQEPPGKLAEYPALYYAIQMALDTKSPVLYVHTKGAGNPIPFIPPIPGRKSIPDFMPLGATLRDWQPTVRKMWYHEFTSSKLNEYITAVSTDLPMVACPFTGKGKATWMNGFIMNYRAAQELYKIFKYTDNRYWYEVMFNDCHKVNVKGLISNTINYPMDDSRFEMYKEIWKFFKPV